MSDGSSILDQLLNLGVAAARTGRNEEAQRYLRAVLKQAPDNIPAMFWLAFVLPSPDDSIRLLERVLALEPDNERARAGIRWAQERKKAMAVEFEPNQTRPHQTQPQPPAQTPTVKLKPLPRTSAATTPVKATQQKLVASRQRRLLGRPVAAIFLLLGIVGLLAVTLGVLAFGPVDTLAAWWPVPVDRSTQPVPVAPSVTFAESPVVAEPAAVVAANRFVSEADTIRLEKIESIEAEGAEEAAELGSSQALSDELVAEGADEVLGFTIETEADTNINLIESPVLLGPELSLGDPQPVENLLLAHQPASPDEKWIEVNVSTQQVTAWEGTKPVFSFISSTGLPNTPTVLGNFNIYWKLESTLMAGPGYYLPEVPYTMYFYRGYALHGTYWHDNFGQPMSHGCVNLETGNARKLFEWADPAIPPGQTQVVATAANPGTLVVVHQ